METAVFFYNLLLLWGFSLCSAGFALVHLQRGQRLDLWVSLTFFLFIFDNTFSYISEFVTGSAAGADPGSVVSMAVTLGIITCYMMVCLSLLERRVSRRAGLLWALFLLFNCGAVLPAAVHPALLALQNLLLELLVSSVLFYTALHLPADRLSASTVRRWRRLLIVVAVCGLLSAAEYIFMCAKPGTGFSSLLGLNSQRRFFLEVLSIYATAAGLAYLFRRIVRPAAQSARFVPQQPAPSAAPEPVCPPLRREEFAALYHLTERERQVLDLALNGCSNQEISDLLVISLGTTKVHLHNIFQKTGVTCREQLRALAADPDRWQAPQEAPA